MLEILKRTLTKRVRLEDSGAVRPASIARRLATAIPTTIAGFLVVAAVSGASPDSRGYDDEVIMESHASSIGMALDEVLAQRCLQCYPCGRHGHRVEERSPARGRGGHMAFHGKPCLENGGGCDTHTKCRGGAGQGDVRTAATDLINSLKSSTPLQLAALLERNSHRLRINESRKALQLIGCQNQVVASYSVTSIPALEAFVFMM